MKKLFLLFLVLIGFFLNGCESKQQKGIKEFNEGNKYYQDGDYDKAIDFFDNSCENGIAEGCYNLAWTMEHKKSSFWTKWYYGYDIYHGYAKSCELGEKDGCKKLEEWKSYKDGDKEWLIWLGIIVIIMWIFISSTGGRRRVRIDADDIADIASNSHHHF